MYLTVFAFDSKLLFDLQMHSGKYYTTVNFNTVIIKTGKKNFKSPF